MQQPYISFVGGTKVLDLPFHSARFWKIPALIRHFRTQRAPTKPLMRPRIAQRICYRRAIQLGPEGADYPMSGSKQTLRMAPRPGEQSTNSKLSCQTEPSFQVFYLL